jgi:hypothetical protein
VSDRDPAARTPEEIPMARYALVVMSEQGEAHPGGQGRVLHALSAAKAFKAAGDEVGLWFHGIGVGWLTAFAEGADRFTQVYRPLFDEVADTIGGACDFCTIKRFDAADGAQALGVPIVGGDGQHHTVADLAREGYTVITF